MFGRNRIDLVFWVKDWEGFFWNMVCVIIMEFLGIGIGLELFKRFSDTVLGLFLWYLFVIFYSFCFVFCFVFVLFGNKVMNLFVKRNLWCERGGERGGFLKFFFLKKKSNWKFIFFVIIKVEIDGFLCVIRVCCFIDF